MPEYVYRAITKEGVVVKNRVESSNKQNLIKKLKNGDLLPIDIIQVGNARKRSNIVSRKNGVDIDEITQDANSATVNQGQVKRKQTMSEKMNFALTKQQKGNI